MKTAEEWAIELGAIGDEAIVTANIVKQILQQGRIEGAKWAAGKARKAAINLASDSNHIPIIANEIEKSILSSLDELKEIK